MLISGQGATAFSRMSNLSTEVMVLLMTVWKRQSMSSLEYFAFGMNLYGFFVSFAGPDVEPLAPAQPIFPIVSGVLVMVLPNLNQYNPVTWHNCPTSVPGFYSSCMFQQHLKSRPCP